MTVTGGFFVYPGCALAVDVSGDVVRERQAGLSVLTPGALLLVCGAVRAVASPVTHIGQG